VVESIHEEEAEAHLFAMPQDKFITRYHQRTSAKQRSLGFSEKSLKRLCYRAVLLVDTHYDMSEFSTATMGNNQHGHNHVCVPMQIRLTR